MRCGWQRGIGPALAMATLVAAAACTDGTSAGPLFDTEVVNAGLLPEVDPSRLYRATEAGINADSLLPILYISGVRFTEAWDPVAHQCAGPLGPTLTLVVSSGGSGATSFGFESGNGIAECTTSVRRYTPSQ